MGRLDEPWVVDNPPSEQAGTWRPHAIAQLHARRSGKPRARRAVTRRAETM